MPFGLSVFFPHWTVAQNIATVPQLQESGRVRGLTIIDPMN